MSGIITDSKKIFGPEECWCTQHGQVYYPCPKSKLCASTNEKYKKLRAKYLESKKYKKERSKRKNKTKRKRSKRKNKTKRKR